MPPLIPSAKATLSYPLCACDFDPLDSSRLVVGGGGGAGRSGVGNKITLFDTSNSTELQEIGELDLSKDEDNVMSLAVSQRKGKATLIFAGVNSSAKDVESGKNAHFRVFGIEPAGKGKQKAASAEKTAATEIGEISRSTLFSGKEKNLYQRITRLSKPYPNQPQLGAIASGSAKDSELILFDTSTTLPPSSRGSLKINREAVDVDFIQTGDNEFQIAYCNEHEIYFKKLSTTINDEEPECIYVIPLSDSFEKPTVPKFRALRWLTKDLILTLGNIHSNEGVVLQIFRLPAPGGGQGDCRIVQSYRLPSSIKKATGLAVANLTPPATPTASQEYTQFVIAVAGHDISLSLFKADLQVVNQVSLTTQIKPFRTLKSVHPLQITGLAFSNFTPPPHPITASTPPQYLKLASISMSYTVIVHTLPLFPVPLSVKHGQSMTPRYVVALPSDALSLGVGVALSVLMVVLVAVVVQGALEIRGAVKPLLGAPGIVPSTWQDAIGRPCRFPSGYEHNLGVPAVPEVSLAPVIETKADKVTPFFEELKANAGDGILVLKEGREKIVAMVHDEEVHGPHVGTKWEELGLEQQGAWTQKLKEAGHWVEGMGETILKGVLFGEVGGAIGQAVAGG